MKKILVIHNKYRIFGGEDSNILDELKILKKEYEIDYLEFDNSDKLKIISIVYLILGINFRSNRLLKKKINNFQPEYVYVHNTWFTANLGIFNILEKNSIKTLLKIHSFRYECSRYFLTKNHLKTLEQCPMCGYSGKNLFNKYFSDSFIKSFFMILYGKRYYKVLLKNNLNILVLNEFHRHKIVEFGIPEEKVKIISNPLLIETQKFRGYSPNSNYVVYAGSLSDSKGITQLVETWKSFKDEKLVLKIIGDGPLKEYVTSNSNQRIQYIGVLDYEKTLEFISNARAVLSFTQMHEGQPRLLSEASALGVPSIYPNTGGISDYFPKNYPLSFIQFNYLNATEMIKLTQNIDLMLKVSKEVKSFTLKNYSSDVILEKYKGLIDEL